MKTRIILALGMLFFSLAGRAQTEVASIDLKLSKISKVLTATDSALSVAYAFQGGKKIQLTILDSTQKVESEFSFPLPEQSKRDNLVAVSLDQKYACLYLFNVRLRRYTSVRVERKTGAVVANMVGTYRKEDLVLRTFVAGSRFYLITVTSGKNEMHTFIAENGGLFSEVTYTVEWPEFYKRLTQDNNLLNEEPLSHVGIEYIRYDFENNLKSTYPLKKLYYINNKIYMTFDDPGATHVIEVDPSTNTTIYRKLNFSLEKGELSKRKQGNSFIYKGKLYRITASPEQMNLSIVDMETIGLNKQYNIYPSEEISFINGQIVEDNSLYGNQQVLKNTEMFFNRVMNGYLAIAVNRYGSNELVMEIGSYYQSTTQMRGAGTGSAPTVTFGVGMGTGFGIGGGGMGGMGIGWGSPYSGMGFPGYWGSPSYYGAGNGNYITEVTIVSFKSLLDEETFSHQNDKLKISLVQRVKDYEKNVLRRNSPDHLRFISYSERQVLMGYYSRNHVYKVVEFLR